MAIDTETPEGAAFLGLNRQLHERRIGALGARRWNRRSRNQLKMRPGIDLLWDYWHGDPPLNDVHQGWKDHIRQYVRMGRLNVAGLLVSSTSNRMMLRDYTTSAADDEQGDSMARSIMRANEWQMGAGEIHDHMLALGDGYGIVTPPAEGGRWALMTAEDPRQVITADDPITRRPRVGLKLYRDDWDSADFAYLYLPGGVIRRAIKRGSTTITHSPFTAAAFNRTGASGWEWDSDYGDNGTVTTPGGRFPVVHFSNQYGTGEFEEHLDSLDRINDKIFNEWWTSKIQAFRQRAVENLPETDEDGTEIDYTDMFVASPDEMWQVPADVKFWESTPVDLNPIVTSIQKDLERLAAVTSQPLHTITPDAANGSAEGASLMREEHLYKIGNRLLRVDRKHAEMMSLAFAFGADDAEGRDDATQIDPMWGPIERFSLTEKASAASQLRGILPNEAIYTDVLQYAPADIPKLRDLAGRDFLTNIPTPQPSAPAPQV